MVFSSILFLTLFLPLFLLLYHLVPRQFKNIFILLSSVLFYSWGAPKFIFVVLCTTFLDFYLVQFMYQSQKASKRKLLLVASLILNLGLLVYFKYCGFFVENINHLLSVFGGGKIEWTKIVLPIGISFFTFESITYVIDVYRKIHKPLTKFWDYQLYILLFPKLIAGPIVRYHEIADQFSDRSKFNSAEYKLSGFFRFCLGLSKKVLIANTMAITADAIFSSPTDSLSSSQAWIGIISYAFQIYFDFSGYSDMAIGLGQIIGFKFPENFNNPYTSQSVTEFWRRWHMTLGSWMKNYLYIPLGGNKTNSKYRVYFNLCLVFIASGFWHGASWTFIFWGAYHGLFLILEKVFLLRWLKQIGKIGSIVYAFFVVLIGWVFFRAENIPAALSFIKNLFAFDFNTHFFFESHYYFCLALAFLFSFFTVSKFGEKIQQFFYSSEIKMNPWQTIVFSLTCLFLFYFSIGSISTSSFNPFIYFRF